MTVLDANHWRNWRSELLIAILLVWAGMVLGVAFLALPVQFGVPSLSRPLAFDIVRHVMSTFGWVQLGIAGVSLLTALLARPHAGVWIALATAWAILALQAA